MEGLKQIEVPVAQWPEFCETFDRAHHGWLVTVTDIATARLDPPPSQPEREGKTISREQPLRRVTLARRREAMELVIEVGEGEEAITVPAGPVMKLFRLRVNDQHQGLRIDTANGRSTLIWFRTPALPEALDGLAPEEL
ncbi:hypothetical protein [Thiohalobacter thiocyanaticus]|uniref:Uncharacterized protein n=1 Tax=Thiohalobacter thiocyanaticus TaxID=585455 RepID=A0A426QGX4_9GAMM|nr:hypothetical protein [Thiohalobacter thiocyanaticus]RRQ21002.1 hypothetical protein D6C00_02800 [Thiohalobacter thiocyanaticus]